MANGRSSRWGASASKNSYSLTSLQLVPFAPGQGGAPKVVSVHNAHVAKLKSCGISGFRFDAAKPGALGSRAVFVFSQGICDLSISGTTWTKRMSTPMGRQFSFG